MRVSRTIWLESVHRSTPADADEVCDWRIFAQRLIAHSRWLYAGDSVGVDLRNTVYARDSTTIDLCLSAWAHFRSTKPAVRCTRFWICAAASHPELYSHLRRQAARCAYARYVPLPEAGAIYAMDRGYVDCCCLHVHQARAFFVTRAKSNLDAHRVYPTPVDRATGLICDRSSALDGGERAVRRVPTAIDLLRCSGRTERAGRAHRNGAVIVGCHLTSSLVSDGRRGGAFAGCPNTPRRQSAGPPPPSARMS